MDPSRHARDDYDLLLIANRRINEVECFVRSAGYMSRLPYLTRMCVGIS
jgi:hypothetical protein